MNYIKIHIGKIIKDVIVDRKIDINRVLNYIQCNDLDLKKIYQSVTIETELLLKFSKVLNFDFFRIYSQHLILYAPLSKGAKTTKENSTPQFRKNLYTKEIIDFVLEQIITEKMTKKEVMEKYRVPKTTLYKWLSKYNNGLSKII